MTEVTQALDDALAAVDVIPSGYVQQLLRLLGLPTLATYALSAFMASRGLYRVDRPASSVQARPAARIWGVPGLGPTVMYARDVDGPAMSWDRGERGLWPVTAHQRAGMTW